MACHLLRENRLVQRCAGERSDDGVLPVAGEPCLAVMLAVDVGEHRKDSAGVEAARERRAYGDIAAHAQPAGVEQQGAQHLHLLLVALGQARQVVECVPPQAARQAPVLHGAMMPRLQAFDARDQASLGGLVGEARAQRHALDQRLVRCRRGQKRQQGLHLRGEGKAAVGQGGVEQGLLAEAVARQEQRALHVVPDGQGPHAVESRQAVGAPLGVGGEDHFRIGLAAEVVALGGQFGADLEEVIDLAVEGDPVAALRIAHRLLAVFRQVEDGQAAVAERDAVTLPEAPPVGPAVGHRVQASPRDVWLEVAELTEDSAHCG